MLFLVPKLPRTVQFEITNKCNLACRMCPREALKVKFEHMPLAIFKRLVDKLDGVEEIILTGWGEPLYHPDIVEMVAYCKKKGFQTRFTTNGILLTEGLMDKLIKLGIDEITFSVESVRPGKDEWGHLNKSSLNNIEKLISKRKKDNLLKITLQAMLQKGKENDILEVIRWAGERGAERVNLGRLELRFNPELKRMSAEEEKKLFAKADKLAAEVGVQLDCVQYGLFSGVSRFFYKHLRHLLHRGGRYCLKIFDYAYVNVDGMVTPCCLLPHMVMGDLKKESLKGIWNGSRFKDFRKRESGFCKRCDVMRVRMVA
jgi:MoaA/NifB/PqqE/SkfB family radical SAM enzyme